MKPKAPQVFAGLDVGRDALDLCVLAADGEPQLTHRRFRNDRLGAAALAETLVGLAPEGALEEVLLSGEATGNYWLPLFLNYQEAEAAPALHLANPRLVAWYKKSRPRDHKTDPRDAWVLADKLRQEARPPRWQTDLGWGTLRVLSRARFQLGRQLARLKNQYWSQMFLFCSGFQAHQPFSDGLGACGRQLLRTYPDWQAVLEVPAEALTQQLHGWSHGRLADPARTAAQLRQAIARSYVLPAPMRAGLHQVLCTTLTLLERVEQQTKPLEKAMQTHLDEYHPEVNHLRNIKGLGVVLAAGIASEIGGLARFFAVPKWDRRQKRARRRTLREVEDAVAKLAGLWWPKRQSGQFTGQMTRLDRHSNAYLRYFLGEAAEKMRRFLPEYQAYYRKKYEESTHHQHQRALTLTARKSVGLFVGLLHRKEAYRPREG